MTSALGYCRNVTAYSSPAPGAEAGLARRICRVALFPIVIASGAVATSLLIDAGHDPGTALLGPQFVSFAIVAVLEHVFPHRVSWNRPQRDVRVDATHSIVAAVLIVLITPLVASGGVVVASSLSSALGSTDHACRL